MSCASFRLIDYNFVFQANTVLTGSSQDSAFPVTNLRHFFRSKVWRTSGNYTIVEDDNDAINFSEGGPELTAILTPGNYSQTTLAAEIKTQMEAVGAFTYTITYSLGYWTVAGSGTFSLLFGTGTDVATQAGGAIGFSAEDYTAAATYTGPMISIHTDETLVIDLRTEEEIDSFAMIFDKVLANKFSEDAVVRLQGSATLNWDSTPVDETLTIDDLHELFTHFFEDDQNYRYWRLQFIDSQNPYGYLEIPKIMLGRRIQITNCPQNGFQYSKTDGSQTQRSLYGHDYVDELPIRNALSLPFDLVEISNMEEFWKSFDRVGIGVPVFVEIDSDEAMFDKDRMFIYGRYASQQQSQHLFFTRFNHPITIEESF